MLFTSYGFLGFLGVLLLLYYMVPGKWEWALLLAFDYLFYFLAGAEYVAYLLVTTATVWFAACRIEDNRERQAAYLKEHRTGMEERRAYKDRQKRRRLGWILAGILLNIGILAVVKYTNFAIANINGILGAFGRTERLSFLNLALPLGISFYTFQAVGYLIDVYRGTAPYRR